MYDATTPSRSGTRRARRKPQKVNYRMMLLLIAAFFFLLSFILMIVTFSRGKKIKMLTTEIETLTASSATLMDDKARLQQELDGLYQAAISALPSPTNAQTPALSDLIPQLTDSIYLIRGTEGAYQYLKIPNGILYNRLISFRDSPDYLANAAESATAWDLWVVYENAVIGMTAGGADHGFVSYERSVSGAEYNLPAGFNAFASSLFG